MFTAYLFMMCVVHVNQVKNMDFHQSRSLSSSGTHFPGLIRNKRLRNAHHCQSFHGDECILDDDICQRKSKET